MYLTNGKLTIRNALQADSEQLCAWWNDGAVMAHAGFYNGVGTTAEKIIAELAEDSDEKGRRHIIELNGNPIGEMNYRTVDYKTAIIGIKICDFSEQEKGYGTALLTMFIDGLFQELGYEKIILDTNLNNLCAQHVYEKIGFRKVGIHAWRDQLGQAQTSVDYELIKKDW
ncbi:MAG: GNAT family N-acetyltransferase [Oscillospiraceae bacterium]|jgi:RimJ/RimL family protein N-acetyltransferase|nr:GNAT family N-acetyltransferase [Oscillospiraceae bacterium]